MYLSRRLFLSTAIVTIAHTALASQFFYSKNGVAIDGYDPVAYFVSAGPVRGTSEHMSEYDGAIWHFSNAENKAMFDENPSQYAPQYGGYCSWAVSKNYTAKIDPNAWTIHDGKLYLNFSTSIRAKWLRDINGNIDKANTNWPALRADLS